MTNDRMNEIYAKVQALLRMAEDDRGNKEEAAVAAMMAAKLIAKYNLDEDAVRNWEEPPTIGHAAVYLYKYLPEEWEKAKKKRDRKPKHIYNRKRQYSPRGWPPPAYYEYAEIDWFLGLAGTIGQVCGCEAAFVSPGSITYVGDQGRCDQAAFLLGNIFRRLLTMAEAAVKRYNAEFKAENGYSAYHAYGFRHPSKWRLGYMEGAVMEINSKLFNEIVWPQREQEIAAFEAGGEAWERRQRALTVQQTAIQAYKEQRFAHAIGRTVEPKDTYGSAAGWEAGNEAGKGFDLQQGLAEGEKRRTRLLKG